MKNLLLLSVIFFFLQNISAQTPGTLKWEFETSGSTNCSPVTSSDGTIYTLSNKLYAINKDGIPKWEDEVGGRHLALGLDGTIYVSAAYEFYAFNPDGTIKWQYVTENNPGPPAIGADGSIYITSYDVLYAFTSEGKKKWQLQLSQYISPPVIGTDGAVFLYNDSKYIAVNPNGKLKWQFYVGFNYSAPGTSAISKDGTVYIIDSKGKLFAIRNDGTRKWELQTGSSFSPSSIVIDADGNIYFGSDQLYAVNHDGTLKWKFGSGAPFYATPAIGSNGTIYVGSKDATFYAINPDGTEKWAFNTGSAIYSSAAIDDEGVLYFGSNGKLYALYTESTGLADSPWPKYGRNNQNTASSNNENCPQAQVVVDFISAQPGEQVTLDGSSSYDPDGESLEYQWRIIEKPQGSPLVLTDSTSAIITTTIPANENGTYRFSLTITDNDDGYSSTRVIASTVLRWVFDLGSVSSEVSATAVADDGTIYIGVNNKLYAVNPDGTEKWTFSTDDEAYNTRAPAIAPDGTIYFAVNDKLYAVAQDGILQWDFLSNGNVSASPAIDINGTIYITAQESGLMYGATSTLNAINPDGTIKWSLNTEYMYTSATPVIGPNGTIYVLSSGGNYAIYWSLLEAISSDGLKQWNASVGVGHPAKSPAIGADGTIYVGSDTLFAINPDGTTKWKFDTNGQFISSPVIGTDGAIFAISDDSTFYAINPDGSEKWKFETTGNYHSERQPVPAIGLDGTIFFSMGNYKDGNGKFYAFNSDGIKKYELPGYYCSSSPAIAPDGTVYFGSNDGKLNALYSDCGGLADSPWPKFSRDNRNSANGVNPNCPVAKVVDDFISLKNGGDVILDGSPSYDPDGDALSYLWRIIEKPQDSNFTLTDSTSAVIKMTIPAGSRESYRFSLIVTDNDDGTSWTSVTVSSEMKWVFNTNKSVGSPALNTDGSIYFNSGCKLYSANTDGSKNWELKINTSGLDFPSIGPDSTIFISGIYEYSGWWRPAYKLFSITHDGLTKWVYPDTAGSAPAIDATGIIYTGRSSKLHAINPDNTLRWEFDPETGSSVSTPAIGSDGTVYINSDYKLFAVNLNGVKQWEYNAPDNIYNSPVISSDGSIYISSQQKLIAVSSAGTKKWESEYGYYNPVIGRDNTIYLGSSNSLAALNPDDGTLNWEYVTGSVISSPAIGEDGTIFFGSNDKFYAVYPDGTLKWQFKTKSSKISAPAIDQTGTIYFGSGTRLYALYSDCGGLADSPWPKFRHDNRNTGNINTPVVSIKKDEDAGLPNQYALYPMYPNPFNPVTHVKFSLPKAGKVQITVYNILGQKVAKLLDAKKTAGVYDISWEASRFASGMYFIRFESATFIKVRKCLLLK